MSCEKTDHTWSTQSTHWLEPGNREPKLKTTIFAGFTVCLGVYQRSLTANLAVFLEVRCLSGGIAGPLKNTRRCVIAHSPSVSGLDNVTSRPGPRNLSLINHKSDAV